MAGAGAEVDAAAADAAAASASAAAAMALADAEADRDERPPGLNSFGGPLLAAERRWLVRPLDGNRFVAT